MYASVLHAILRVGIPAQCRGRQGLTLPSWYRTVSAKSDRWLGFRRPRSSVLHAISSPALGPQFIACNTPAAGTVCQPTALHAIIGRNKRPVRTGCASERRDQAQKFGNPALGSSAKRTFSQRWAFHPNLKNRERIAITDSGVKFDIGDNDDLETVWPASVSSMNPPF
jgi:hypothetical protein